MNEEYMLIIAKIANGIGNCDSNKSIIDYAEAGGCSNEQINLIKDAMKKVYSGIVC